MKASSAALLAGALGLCLTCLAPDTNEPQLPAEPASADSAPEPALSLAATDAAIDPVPASPASPAAGDVEIPAPGPEPAAPPPSPEQIEALLADAASSLQALGVARKPIRHLRGPHPEPSGLDAAYAEDRAIGYEGTLVQVREWMALAKFGVQAPTSTAQSGPLARYDLCVTRKGEQAWLHVIVPASGLAEQKGAHYKAESRERWVLLSDRAEPGVDYEPFKRNAAPSLARQWGREKVVDDLVRLARKYRDRTGARLGIGDISHVTGGKMQDHWTHRVGADADVYLLDYSQGDPRVIFHQWRRGRSVWSERPDGKGAREQPDDAGRTPTAQRLRALAELVLPDDDVAYFVHNDPEVLVEFDEQARARKPGRRFLHARNKGYWPVHDDHVHLRWIDGPLPVGVTPRP